MEYKSQKFNSNDSSIVYQVLESRRDVRHFVPNKNIDNDKLDRILSAAYSAPSVGLMQPWRIIQIKNPDIRTNISQLVQEEINKTAIAFEERKREFLKLKVEGIKECSELLVVVQIPDDGTIFGRRTMPEEMALCSTACAIQNMWLASRVENIGMGWVSMFEPQQLASLLECPQNSKPIAILCLGYDAKNYEQPMLEIENWRIRKPQDSFITIDKWQHKNN